MRRFLMLIALVVTTLLVSVAPAMASVVNIH